VAGSPVGPVRAASPAAGSIRRCAAGCRDHADGGLAGDPKGWPTTASPPVRRARDDTGHIGIHLGFGCGAVISSSAERTLLAHVVLIPALINLQTDIGRNVLHAVVKFCRCPDCPHLIHPPISKNLFHNPNHTNQSPNSPTPSPDFRPFCHPAS